MKINPVSASALHRPTPHEPPAKAARTALASRPDLADQPFGRLVSLFAKGEPLPSSAPTGPTVPGAPGDEA
jgi:hypothetical protein